MPAVPDCYDDIAVAASSHDRNTVDFVENLEAMQEQKQKLLDDILYKVIQSYIIRGGGAILFVYKKKQNDIRVVFKGWVHRSY